MKTWSLVVLALSSAPIVARAQSATVGAIQGRVTDEKTGKPLEGVTVFIEGPSLIEPQMTITDENGQYKITQLPPGDGYKVTFISDTATVEHSNVPIGANDVTSLYQAIKRNEVIRVKGRPPQIDITSTDHGSKLDRSFLTAIPLPSRSADGAAGAQAGAHNDGIGTAFSGSTSLENRYLVDGIDITGLTYGDVGTPVLNEFVHEIEILAGGYNAEWGRAIGGIVNIVTKTGSNQLRGSVFGTFASGALTAARKTAPVDSASIDITADTAYRADFGVELGGPVIKDRLWFYAGFAPQLSRTDYTRATKMQLDCRRAMPDGTRSDCDRAFADGEADVDPVTGFHDTEEIDSEIRTAKSATYSMIGKLNLAVTPQHQAQLSAIVVPNSSRTPGLLGLPTSGRRGNGTTIDIAARWSSKLGDKTEVEALVAWHHARFENGSLDPTLDATPLQILAGGNLGTWSTLGGESLATQQACADGGAGDAFPTITNCPMDAQSYAIGGPGPLADDREDRRMARVAVLQRGRLAGTHEVKAGLDLEDDTKQTGRLYSGGALLTNFVGSSVLVNRWVQLARGDTPTGNPRFEDTCRTPDPDATGAGNGMLEFRCDFISGERGAPGTRVEGQTVHWAAFLRDSWQPRPNLAINIGARYEEQRLQYSRDLRGTMDPLTGQRIGKTAMNLTGNIAPRLGVIWDPTEQGRSKVFGSWGRFFEAIPMDINDRSFGGEVSYQQFFQTDGGNCGPTDPRIGGADGNGCLSSDAQAASEQLIGSSGVLVAPGIRSQYLDELLLGTEYQLAEDLKLGVTYQNRRLGRVIEDVSTDGAQTYIIANPGEFSEDAERELEQRIAAEDDDAARGRLENQLAMFRGIRRFDRPRRNYDALEISVAKRLSRGLFVQASYTHSRTDGNFPGSVSYDNGQVDPNISSQYDLIELLANRSGRLPQDRPHSVKLDGYYKFDLGKHSALTAGTRLRAVSGTPINALGAHYLYGGNESFLLPRGALGRTAMQHSADLHLAYGRKLPRGMVAEFFVDVFSIFNQQGEFSVDTTYAPQIRRATAMSTTGVEQNVNPISGGSYEDLIFAKVIDRTGTETSLPIGRNPNFGNTAARYAPASARIGFRLTF